MCSNITSNKIYDATFCGHYAFEGVDHMEHFLKYIICKNIL